MGTFAIFVSSTIKIEELTSESWLIFSVILLLSKKEYVSMCGNNVILTLTSVLYNCLYELSMEKYIKATYIYQKAWYNSYLTFQNLKKDARNLMFTEDRENVWVPWTPTQNIENSTSNVVIYRSRTCLFWFS